MIKVIALDIYGTILASDDVENLLPPRKGFSELVKKCKNKNIKIITASDSDITNLKIDLKESRIDLSIFNNFYELKTIPKNFKWILDDYNILPQELLVIGDREDIDIKGAKRINAKYCLVPEYRIKGEEFDLSKIDLE